MTEREVVLRRSALVELALHSRHGITSKDFVKWMERRHPTEDITTAMVVGWMRSFDRADLVLRTAVKHDHNARWWPTVAAHRAVEILCPQEFRR